MECFEKFSGKWCNKYTNEPIYEVAILRYFILGALKKGI
jgi:hypothetical protein